MNALKELSAGAFIAVAQAEPQDASIVHLTYNPASTDKHIAIVGKGICFDTGGHNIKPAKYMLGMHEDMNDSAASLGIMLEASQMKLPIKLDCWLAIPQNHIGPNAFKQNDVITALNGMTIEFIHTDAEGRMVLADTLTGSMSGVITNRTELATKASDAGSRSGERIATFPYDDDFDSDLGSAVADIKQCTLDGEADHYDIQ